MTRLYLTALLFLPLPLTAQTNTTATAPKARAVEDPANTPPAAVAATAAPKAKPAVEPAPPKAKPAAEPETPAAPKTKTPPPDPSKVAEADANGNYAPQPKEEEVDTIVRIQIYLDEKMNGPGYIDGRLGEFGKKAASVYNQIRGIPVGNWHALIEASAKAVPEPYTTYTIMPGDSRYITPTLPTKPQDQAKVKYLGYRSFLEFVSERYHTSEPFLQWLNKGQNLNNLDPGDTLKVPNVTPFKLEEWPKHKAFEKDSATLSARTVAVDIAARVAIFFDENNKPCASFPITPGQPKFIKFGEWSLTSMVSTPEFRWDKAMLEQGKRSSEYYQLPLGPNSPVGVIWTGTTKTGVGLHGTASPHTIGRSESAGCIRFANWDAARLPQLIRPGARLVIR